MEGVLKELITYDVANHYRILPVGQTDNTLEFLVDNKNNTAEISDELELLFGKQILLIGREETEINSLLRLYYKKERKGVESLLKISSDFLESLIADAKSLKSSDIHFEIYEREARVRFRIDGQLIERYRIDMDNYLEIVNKIKIQSKLNITEKRLPQDGRITTDSFDIRVSILPTLFGEKIVMRLLSNDTSKLHLHAIGFDPEEYESYIRAIKKPNGIILISGPTGSGKTTTLYATLKVLNDISRNIVTVEDPIEYTLPGINQVQLKEDIGLTFSTALKSFLRQDPDVIMLGEIRDAETAMMAIRASLTGHLVLSTIHTNSSIGTISRLIDMGIPSFLLAETLNISVAQRLIRVLCKHCKERTVLAPSELPSGLTFEEPIEFIYSAVGCNHCFHTGYSGRQAIYELLDMKPEVVQKIKTEQSINANELPNHATLKNKALQLLISGTTSLEEIYPILINN